MRGGCLKTGGGSAQNAHRSPRTVRRAPFTAYRAAVWGALALCLCVQSCFLKPQDRNINLEAVPDITYGAEWAVITEPYASFRSEPSFEAETVTHGRRGDIMKVQGRQLFSRAKKQTVWYQFEGGWLPDVSVNIYSNRLKARTASDSL